MWFQRSRIPRNPYKTDYSQGFPAGFEFFASISDPRDGGHTRHRFGEILFIAFAAVLCGVRSYELMEEFGEFQEKWLRKWLALPHGIPCANTFSRVFQAIEPTAFATCIAAHLARLGFAMEGGQIAIDGKALRGSRSGETSHLHAVSAWACEAGITLAQTFVSEKSNEITAIPELLEMLPSIGRTTTKPATATPRPTTRSFAAWPSTPTTACPSKAKSKKACPNANSAPPTTPPTSNNSSL